MAKLNLIGLNVVLYEPEIPQNTGNIARTCAALGAKLHLIKPLGFSLRDRYLKRAGLDYWHLIEIFTYDSISEFLSRHREENIAFITKTAGKSYDKIDFSGNLFLIFGKETAGIPQNILKQYPEACYRIPMKKQARSLNLSNAAAIVAYEALRQNHFKGLSKSGTNKEDHG
jgi:tRNA (cytidine/uridine-2'-O-)-methyltransferase